MNTGEDEVYLMLLPTGPICRLAAVLLAAAPAQRDSDLSAIRAGTLWGKSSSALLARFGARATALPQPIDFGDSYANVVLRDVRLGGVRMIAFFEMDKRTGGLKRIQIERPRHGVDPPAFRAVLNALEGAYGRPDAVCSTDAEPAGGYQAAVAGMWRRGAVVIRAIFRDTTIAAVEGCLSGDLSAGRCGLTGELLVRISPATGGSAGCFLPSPPVR